MSGGPATKRLTSETRKRAQERRAEARVGEVGAQGLLARAVCGGARLMRARAAMARYTRAERGPKLARARRRGSVIFGRKRFALR